MGSKLYSQLFTALHKGQLRRIRHLMLNEGCLVNYEFGDSSFPLHIVAEKGYLDVLQFLLAYRASVDLKNRHGQTPLLLGIDHQKIVQILISHGAKVNLSDPQRRTALHMACSHGAVETVRNLLSAGAWVNAPDKWSRTPLHVALLNISQGINNQDVSKNFFSVVKLLLKHGAAVNKSDCQYSTPLFLAAQNGCLSIAQQLIQHGARPDQPSRHKLTPLMVAIMKGHEEVCQLLVHHNCDINKTRAVSSSSGLQIAVKKGFINIAQLLVISGCKLQHEGWLYEKWHVSIQRQDDTTLEWLRELVHLPQTLKQLCRTKIRQTCDADLVIYVGGLHYPESLKEYLLLHDIIPEKIYCYQHDQD